MGNQSAHRCVQLQSTLVGIIMSIFGNILSGIFGHAHAQSGQTPPKTVAPQQAPAGMAQSPASTQRQASGVAPQPATAANRQQPSAPVDVEPILDDLVSKKKEKLDWRHSIVDMMKALDLDSSLSARQELAKELHYSGNMSDSAAMNIWLHKQVMTKLAENGGKVPENVKH
jgi:hypothetical protein